MKSPLNKRSVKWVTAVLVVLVIVIGVGVMARSQWDKTKVTDFESCKAAGGMILETYPEQCMVNGVSYTNEAQSSPEYPDTTVNEGDYIGLSENDALAKAESENIPARVVEREGEGLPTTMDFVYGRLNLYVQDGLVYKVDVEGQATDAPKSAE